ncbi:MAG: 5-(carboxyamino)imidazole ribonucleotide synthase [Deltaproteobacteria bacterium]|nr:MAG: 5-(carboxyamino)imidazole ribonucleotide synthase [Deltaproteobacteria bacterium]
MMGVPRPRIGILGDGQLGRMLTLAALPLGLDVRIVSSGSAASTCPFLGRRPPLDGDDPQQLDALARAVDVVTVESENVRLDWLEALAARVTVLPSPAAVGVAQDRVREKEALQAHGIATAQWRQVDDAPGLHGAVRDLGFPLVLKTRRFGYDGKGQRWLRAEADVAAVPESFLARGLIAEAAVPFTRELSLVCTRSGAGDVAFWPLVENVHRGGILVRTEAPARDVAPPVEAALRAAVARMLDGWSYVGTFALELFDTPTGVVANEMAPRVHNTGHWTQAGTATCQFANHVRAVAGLPIDACAEVAPTVMLNVIGGVPDARALLAIPGVSLHLYGKEPRPGRKLGHVNVLLDRAGAQGLASAGALVDTALRLAEEPGDPPT